MRRAALLAVAASLACARGGGAGRPGPAAVASGPLRNAAGQRVGVVTLTDTAGVLRLAVSVGDLTPGLHGLHVHAAGECTPPDFTSAGAHFNPGHRQHGRLNPDGPHAGDLPNLLVGPDGSADTSFVWPGAAAVDKQPPLTPAGKAVVIHARPDDERTDPGGDSGDRLACAVLEPG